MNRDLVKLFGFNSFLKTVFQVRIQPFLLLLKIPGADKPGVFQPGGTGADAQGGFIRKVFEKLKVKIDEFLYFYKLRVNLFFKLVQAEKVFGKGCVQDAGEKVIFAIKIIVEKGLGNASLFGDLEGRGAFKTLTGKKPDGGFEYFLLLVQVLTFQEEAVGPEEGIFQ